MDPAATVTDDGVLSSFALSDRATTAPPEGAGPARATVQVVLANEIKLVELQASVESTGAVRFKVTLLETPASVAWTVAL